MGGQGICDCECREYEGGSVYLCECETGVCRLYNVDIGTLV